jgi:hypothetical protein
MKNSVDPLKDNNRSFYKRKKIGFIAIAAFVFVTSICFWGWSNRGPEDNVFEIINVLFSGFAFAILMITVLMQKEELELQRNELRETRAEFKQQNQTLIQQKFENTFFQLLQAQNEIIKLIDLKRTDQTTGRDCFRLFYEKYFFEAIDAYKREIKSKLGSVNVDIPANEMKLEINEIIAVYSAVFYKKYQSELGHYFRNLYQIIKFVDSSTLAETDKYRYIKLIRAQLSSYELVLLFYNCLSKVGFHSLKPLVERYALFKNIDEDLLFDAVHKRKYSVTAFGRPGSGINSLTR